MRRSRGGNFIKIEYSNLDIYRFKMKKAQSCNQKKCKRTHDNTACQNDEMNDYVDEYIEKRYNKYGPQFNPPQESCIIV